MAGKLTDYFKKAGHGKSEDMPMDEDEDEKMLEMYHMLNEEDKAEVMGLMEELCYDKEMQHKGSKMGGTEQKGMDKMAGMDKKGKSGALVITIGK